MVHGPEMAEPRSRLNLRQRYGNIRTLSEALAAPLSREDQCVQSMPDASPTKWHLAHVTWFFETLVLMRHAAHYDAYDRRYHYLFNSYYEVFGSRHARQQRGLLTRPSGGEILRYRRHVDKAMYRLLDATPAPGVAWIVELGLQHEQQHQELILTDIKHAFGLNPLFPQYAKADDAPAVESAALSWLHYSGGIYRIGSAGAGFAFDNEQPRHPVVLAPFRLATRLVTCGEYLAFIRDGGYRRPELWLSDGWNFVQSQAVHCPLYWIGQEGEWQIFTLHGVSPLRAAEPVVHVSFYEADAYARWRGKRLPTEFEWEAATANEPVEGNLLDLTRCHPRAADEGERQFFGDAWEWTRSAYEPYPGFKPWDGIASEYNGKFMCSQMVLRGGSCVTPAAHIRASYRNFFPPSARWQFSGIRLAEDA